MEVFVVDGLFFRLLFEVMWLVEVEWRSICESIRCFCGGEGIEILVIFFFRINMIRIKLRGWDGFSWGLWVRKICKVFREELIWWKLGFKFRLILGLSVWGFMCSWGWRLRLELFFYRGLFFSGCGLKE